MRAQRYWSGLRESFWFVPTLIVALSIVLAIALTAIDSAGPRSWMDHWPRLFGAGAEGARGMLSTIAGSMMTVVGVTFSMTLVVLALASSQYTSRILRGGFRPSSRPASSCPMNSGNSRSTAAFPEQTWQPVLAQRSGYIQSVDNDALLGVARDHRTLVRMERRIGEFVVRDTTLASLAMAQPLTPAALTALRGAYDIHHHRTVEQDAGFGIRQIVDMALRALSPGINDTTTAVMCIDYLTTILARLSSRSIPSSHRYEDGDLRVITMGPTFASMLDASFDQTRASVEGNAAVMLRLLGALKALGDLTASHTRRDVLRQHVSRIAEAAARTIESPSDLARIEQRLASVRPALDSVVMSACGAQ